MKDKYLPEEFEGGFPTQAGDKTPASRMVFSPRGIFTLLIALLACFSIYIPKTFAEEKAIIGTRTDQPVQELGSAKMAEDQPRGKRILILHTLKAKRPWNTLFNRYFVEALPEVNLSFDSFEIEHKGKIMDLLSKLRIIERKSHWRAFSMSADRFARIASDAGLQCISQEIVNWKTSPKRLIDCLSAFTIKGSHWERPNQLIRNDGFMREAKYLSKLSKLYGTAFAEKKRRSVFAQRSK